MTFEGLVDMGGSFPHSPLPIFNFSTLDYPEKDRFQVWVQGTHCDCRLTADDTPSLAATASGADFGSFILAGRKWLNRHEDTAFEIRRTRQRIRTDGLDFFRFTLLLRGRFRCRQPTSTPIKTAGDLFLFDATQINECSVEGDDVLSLVIPRDLLPTDAALLHSETLSGAIGRLLADYITSLFANLAELRTHDVPHLVQATLQLLTAAVSPTPDALQAAQRPIRDALFFRVQHYVDRHLLDPELSPDRICRDVGLSRAKLYQLFETSGGIMRSMQRRRLRRAYHVLADASRPRPRVADIAWQHGFANDKYFHRLFKHEFGHTPLETLDSIAAVGRLMPNGSLSRPREQDILPSHWTLPFGVPST